MRLLPPNQEVKRELGHSSVVGCLSGVCEVLSSILRSGKKEKEGEGRRRKRKRNNNNEEEEGRKEKEAEGKGERRKRKRKKGGGGRRGITR